MDVREQLQHSLGNAYSLERELAGGGMSRVFVAHESALGRRVVVKVLPPEAAAAVSVERFQREIAFAARLQHPHIVPLLTAGEMEGIPYFTMPFVEGESLRVRLAGTGELPVTEAMRLLREIASALAYAHGQGVVHRDIKPDNVLLSGGSAMVTDFGVAKAVSASTNPGRSGTTSMGLALGTPAYMAPEQASADPAVDHRADIYSFGVLAYEVLTGRTPFGGRAPQAMLAAHIAEAPRPVTQWRASISPALGALIMQCLEKRPADRPQSGHDLMHALDGITTPSETAAVQRRFITRKMVAASLGVAAVAIAIGAAMLQRRADSNPRSLAVLQFIDASGDTSRKYLAVGITDELTAALSKIPGLTLLSRSVTDATGETSAVAAGRKLGVDAVLEGRVRVENGEVALMVQLTRTSDGKTLWSNPYRAAGASAFAVEAELARVVAAALEIKLASAQVAGMVREETKSQRAHDAYLRGRYLQAEYTEASLKRSIEFFNQAIAEDSSYAAAWAAIADSWGSLADDFMKPTQVQPYARAAIDRAIALDPRNPALVGALGTRALFNDRKLDVALQAYSQALRQDSTLVIASRYYALALALDGQTDSARAMIRRIAADRADPISYSFALSLALQLTADTAVAEELCKVPRGRHERACRLLELEKRGRADSAFMMFDSLATASDGLRERTFNQVMGVYYLARMGRVSAARALAAQVEKNVSGIYYREDHLATMWASVGDADRAYRWLLKAKESNSGGLTLLRGLWREYAVRKDPRIERFIRENAVGKPVPGW